MSRFSYGASHRARFQTRIPARACRFPRDAQEVPAIVPSAGWCVYPAVNNLRYLSRKLTGQLRDHSRTSRSRCHHPEAGRSCNARRQSLPCQRQVFLEAVDLAVSELLSDLGDLGESPLQNTHRVDWIPTSEMLYMYPPPCRCGQGLVFVRCRTKPYNSSSFCHSLTCCWSNA
jgi:hypothetical protein